MLDVLGPLELRAPDGTPVALTSPRQRRLLAALALRAGVPVDVDVLAEHVWGDGQPGDPAAALHTNVARLRRLLPAGVEVVTGPGTYRLVIDRAALDVTAFEDDIASRRPDEAIARWRGDPYPELDGPAVATEAHRLRELRHTAVEARAEALLEARRPAEAVADLEALVGAEPLREAAVALLMRALVAAGRQSDALRAFTRLRTTLAEELGIEPSAALRSLEAEVLRQELPTTAPVGPRRPGLPVSSFVGRGQEIAHVVELVAAARVVTLCGPGGVGKTRLARHVAHEIAGRYDDGVVRVDLAAVATGDAVAAAVAAALRLTPSADATLVERIVDVLGVRRHLLLLDDAEHVAEAVAEVVEAITIHTDGVDVLVTSREPIRVDGEHVVTLAPLPTEKAVALLSDRIRASAPEALPGDEGVLAAIAARLDGLPLALELAAARVPALGLAGLADALEEPLTVLRQGRRPAHPRHRSLRDVVEWSYGLLTEPERELFLAMSVFAGPVGAEAVGAVSLDGDARATTIGVLADLVDRSLVVVHPGPPPTYGMLTTVRSYGRSLLATSRQGIELRDHHARWAVALAEWIGDRFTGPEEAAAVARLNAHVAELGRALAWLSANERLDDVLRVGRVLAPAAAHGLRADLVTLVDQAVAAVGDAAHPSTPRLLGMAATSRWQRGDLDGAEEWCRRAFRVAEVVGLEAGREAELAMANVAFFRGDLAAACDREERARDLARAAGDRAVEAEALLDLSLIEAYRGNAAEAAAHLAAGTSVAEALASHRLLGWAAYVAGENLAEHDPGAAVPHLERAVALAGEVDAVFLGTLARHTLLTSAGRAGRAGLDEYARLIDDWHRAGAWTQLWVAMRSLIDALARHHRYEEATHLLGALDASPRAAPSFGPDRDRLEAVAAAARAALSDDAYEERRRAGAALGDEGAVALARRAGTPVPEPA